MEKEQMGQIIASMEKVIIGKRDVIELALITLLAKGHLLIEDVPGVGKTTLAKTLAAVLGCDYKRIQFTPDTLPSDVTGVSVYQMNTGTFKYMPGSVMSQIVLADEINRATEKTQASLLEAMGEYQVSVDGSTYKLPRPFMVMATQNPIDELGTFTLPEAELDRFMMKISIGYPGMDDELDMVNRMLTGEKDQSTAAVADAKTVIAMQSQVEQVYIHPDLVKYMTRLTDATRHSDYLTLGASPRALLAWVRASQAAAYIDSREYVIPDDILKVMNPVLMHRLILNSDARINQMTPEKILAGIRTKVALPILADNVLAASAQ